MISNGHSTWSTMGWLEVDLASVLGKIKSGYDSSFETVFNFKGTSLKVTKDGFKIIFLLEKSTLMKLSKIIFDGKY